MPSLVKELQRGALDESTKVSALLRKAYVVARKLNLTEFQTWVERELRGYRDCTRDDLPPYRILRGELKGLNPIHGWVPVIGEGLEGIEKVPCFQSVAEIEDLVATQEGATFYYRPSEKQQKALGKLVGFRTEFTVVVSRSSLAAILDAVRNTILEWALDLESRGIKGIDLEFTDDEVEQARSAPQLNQYNNYYLGPIGVVQAQQGTVGSYQIEARETYLNEISPVLELVKQVVERLPPSQRDLADTYVSEVEAQVKSANPNRSTIREALTSLREILEGAAATVLGSELPNLLGRLQSLTSKL